MQFNPNINEPGNDRRIPGGAARQATPGPGGGRARGGSVGGPRGGQPGVPAESLAHGASAGSIVGAKAASDLAVAAHRYHTLISSMRFGEAFDACWDEHIEMRWLDGRVFRGFGTCAAMVSSALARAVVVQLISHEPVLHARGYIMEVVSRQRWLEEDTVFQTSREYDHILDPSTLRITQITEISCRLRRFTPDGTHEGLAAGPDLQGAEALAWLGSRGV